MDQKQFEDLTKAMANGQSRRRIIKVLAGGVVSGVAGLFGGRRGTIGPGPAAAGATTTTKAPATTTTRAPATTTTTTKAPATTTTTTTRAPATTTTTTKAPATTTTRPPFCGHSTGLNGGCMGACTSAGFTGQQCGRICGTGQITGACPVGQGGGNPCCSTAFCIPSNFRRVNGVLVGPTCP